MIFITLIIIFFINILIIMILLLFTIITVIITATVYTIVIKNMLVFRTLLSSTLPFLYLFSTFSLPFLISILLQVMDKAFIKDSNMINQVLRERSIMSSIVTSSAKYVLLSFQLFKCIYVIFYLFIFSFVNLFVCLSIYLLTCFRTSFV